MEFTPSSLVGTHEDTFNSMATSIFANNAFSVSVNRSAINSTKSAGVVLWLATLVLIFNVSLIISGIMADSSEFVGALHDNLVVEPHSFAVMDEALSLFFFSAILLICLLGIPVRPGVFTRAGIVISRQTAKVVNDDYRQPFVQQSGSRAPPSDK